LKLDKAEEQTKFIGRFTRRDNFSVARLLSLRSSYSTPHP